MDSNGPKWNWQRSLRAIEALHKSRHNLAMFIGVTHQTICYWHTIGRIPEGRLQSVIDASDGRFTREDLTRDQRKI